VSRKGCDGRGGEERTAAKALWARYVIVFHAREFRTVLLQLSTVEIFSWKFSCVRSAWPFAGLLWSTSQECLAPVYAELGMLSLALARLLCYVAQMQNDGGGAVAHSRF
jgi:hypothetical protein